ncbi:hypothetical protein L6164_007731 [Bauhinia variegata]|uniref:Uncharacterized protein n=1 Tax=Bauhinia variegata TaxID=167791 RepID=A0ACB9PET5_BAUVA|nr:hypothetical protein L6164_007731 [Bauhinia variegata]
MKLEVRTNKGGRATRFFVEVKPDDSIASLKEKIEAVQGRKYFPVEKQILSFWRKGLRENLTIEQNNLKDNDILMVYILQRMPTGPPPIDEVIPIPAVARDPAVGQAANPQVQAPQPAVPASGPNADPLNLFPQPMLQELEKQNPNLMQFIQEHQSEFSRFMNEPIEGKEAPAAAVPQSVILTPEERAAIQRLQDMGFARESVMVVFFAFNKNEQQAANYLSDHKNEFDN